MTHDHDGAVPGLAERARRWFGNLLAPDVQVVEPPAGITVDWDVPVTVRDGTILRVNVFRPDDGRPVPAIMSAHPYGKDKIPANSRSGKGLSFQYRLFQQPEPVRISAWTSWEAPDPAFWVPRGYAVVNADLRGCGTSEGRGELLSDQEAEDYFDLIEWVGVQPWCSGRVGLDGVSYLAISQYKVASLHPPHLAAICPWEGFSDMYRDFARPGGVREDGFSIMWSTMTRRADRVDGDIRKEIVNRPERDRWYESVTPRLEEIEVPALVCGSFSDHNLHSRGSFEAFRRIGSSRKWLFTHRGGKWSTYYSQEAYETRAGFFDRFLKGVDNGWDSRPRVRVAVHEAGATPAAIFECEQWPPPDLRWTDLFLDAVTGTLGAHQMVTADTAVIPSKDASVGFTWTVPDDMDLIGHVSACLYVETIDVDDANLMVAVRKFRNGREVGFEGSYGFAFDSVSKGWQRVAHREIDEELSTPWQPVHTHRDAVSTRPGEIVEVHIALRPQATRMRAGEQLVFEVRGDWPLPRDPLRGQLPAAYQSSAAGRIGIHTGGAHPSRLLIGHRPVG